jgi:thiol-disulfide isomerase/thioredoxin
MLLLLLSCVPSLYTDATKDTGTFDNGWVAPENTWSSNAPPSSLKGEGCRTGDVLNDHIGTDQHGDEVSLWQFYGSCTLVDIGTMWCGPCRELAATFQETAEHYPEVQFVQLLPEDDLGNPTSVEKLNEWAEFYGIEEPVVSDDAGWHDCAVPEDVFPAVLIVGPDMKVLDAGVTPANEATIMSRLEELCY